MSVKLKPCPFCGSKAESGNGFLPFENITFAWCSNEDCYLSPLGREAFLMEVKEWNTRTASIAPQSHARGLLGDQGAKVVMANMVSQFLAIEAIDAAHAVEVALNAIAQTEKG